MVTRECDAVVVGSGPGGATVARELARAGKDVLLLEKGKYHRDLGSYLGAARMLDRAGFYKSREGVSMLKATTAGGATMVYSGSAAMPPPWLYPKYGIDLNPDAQETWEELGVDFLPDDLAGEASMRVMDAANAIGYQWEKSPKIMDTAKFVNGKCCGARTSLGCTCGAKWTARDYIAQAESAGAAFQTSAECLDVIVENGTAKGVVVRRNDETAEVRAPTVVLAAGGYPGAYRQGDAITGIPTEAEGAKVFHAGTAQAGQDVVNDGGRVLGVTAVGDNVAAAKKRAYEAVKCIRWDGAWCRKDISDKARDALELAARGSDNLMPHILKAVKAKATLGEISDTLRAVCPHVRTDDWNTT